jgi:GAF domain-containing protein
MTPDNNRHYGKWSREELRNAEATARQFLEDNSAPIADTMRAKAKFLETLVHRISLKKTTFEERLDYFARISEIARLIQEDADGFFELASQPMVARILGTIPQK